MKIRAVIDGAPTNDPDIIRMVNYWQSAEYFGWTPEQTDRVENHLLEEMIIAAERKRERENTENGRS